MKKGPLAATAVVLGLAAAAGGTYALRWAPRHRSSAPVRPIAPVSAPTTAFTFPPDGPAIPLDAASRSTAVAVSYTLSGRCHLSGSRFTCRVAVRSSRGAVSGGAVVIDPDRDRTPGCAARAAVVKGVSEPAGACPRPAAATAFAYYTLGPPGPGDLPLATAALPYG